MLKNIVPALVTASKFAGRIAGGTIVAMGTMKATEFVADKVTTWWNKPSKKSEEQAKAAA